MSVTSGYSPTFTLMMEHVSGMLVLNAALTRLTARKDLGATISREGGLRILLV
jgi:hypothetical protein